MDVTSKVFQIPIKVKAKPSSLKKDILRINFIVSYSPTKIVEDE